MGISENSICHLTPVYWGGRNPLATNMVAYLFWFFLGFSLFMFFFLYSLNAALPGLKSKIAVPARQIHIPHRQDCQFYAGNSDRQKQIHIRI